MTKKVSNSQYLRAHAHIIRQGSSQNVTVFFWTSAAQAAASDSSHASELLNYHSQPISNYSEMYQIFSVNGIKLQSKRALHASIGKLVAVQLWSERRTRLSLT